MSNYVHQEVTLVCSNGMNTTNLVIPDRKARIVNQKLLATIQDKPNSFGCKWLGVMVALLTALACVAIIGTGGLAAFAIGAAVGVGAAAGSSLIGGICTKMTKPDPWQNFHPKVFLEGKNTLVGASTLTCSKFGGHIFIFYSKELAQMQARAFFTKNMVEIMAAAGIGSFLGGNLGIVFGKSVFSAKALNLFINFSLAGVYYASASKLDGALDSARDQTADWLYDQYGSPQTLPAGAGVDIGGQRYSSGDSPMKRHKDQTNQDYEENTFWMDDGLAALARDPAKDFLPNDMKPPENRVSRAERRAEYMRKPKPVRDANGTLRRSTSLYEQAQAERRARNARTFEQRQAANQPFKNRANRRVNVSRAGSTLKGAAKEFALLTAITWVADVAASYLQKDVDMNMQLEASARAAEKVHAEEI